MLKSPRAAFFHDGKWVVVKCPAMGPTVTVPFRELPEELRSGKGSVRCLVILLHEGRSFLVPCPVVRAKRTREGFSVELYVSQNVRGKCVAVVVPPGQITDQSVN